jgi:hypothetical protein
MSIFTVLYMGAVKNHAHEASTCILDISQPTDDDSTAQRSCGRN